MESLLDIKQTAERLGIKPITLRTWITKRLLPYHKIGKLIKFVPSEIDEWIASKKVEANPDWIDKKVASMLDVRYKPPRRQPDLK